ncbi:Phospholipase D/nuclease [Mycena venus]|uniref:Phospholipase D/nuclease n=1 Tax=Mycena venus TaxID=2733690 RepID=A0A8H7CMI2_9AGAR|nr:Phospholipase D/nuclease [Mycena venus]
MAGSCTSSPASTRPKCPKDSGSDSVQEKKEAEARFAHGGPEVIMAEYDRSNSARPPLPMKYASGALQLTRTPGRQHAPNTILFDDLIHPQDLGPALFYSFLIEDPYLFDFFPFKTNRHHRPYVHIYVGRHIAMDADGKQFSGCKPRTKRPKPVDFDCVVDCTKKGYREQYVNNFHVFYPKLQSGCAHSKIVVLMYPDFMRGVITSANFATLSMGTTIDISRTFLTSPTVPRIRKSYLSDYLKAGVFDFSATKVRLMTSKPGSFSGEQAYEYGQLRRCKVVRNILKKRYGEDKNNVHKMTFEM